MRVKNPKRNRSKEIKNKKKDCSYFICRSKTPLSKKMSTLQNMKAPNSMKKGHHTDKSKQRRASKKLGKKGGIQTASKKKRTRQ